MDKKSDVLNYLLEQSDGSFLSDLHIADQRQTLKVFFEQSKLDQFSLEEWQYAYNYIFGKEQVFDAIETVRQQFLKHL